MLPPYGANALLNVALFGKELKILVDVVIISFGICCRWRFEVDPDW